MTEESNNAMHGDLHDRLVEYGRWLDDASNEYLRTKESGVEVRVPHGIGQSPRATKFLAAVAATVLIVAGSFVVNQWGGSSGSSHAALAWSATPTETTDARRQVVIDACERANPDSATFTNVKTAIDIRGSLAVLVWVKGSTVDVCLATLDHDQPGARVVHDLSLDGASDVPAVQVLSMHSESQIIAVVVGRDSVLPADCSNLDVFTNKGVVRALRASGIFAFWYPGSSPGFTGTKSSSIQYACAVEDDTNSSLAPKSTMVGADPFANLCIATLTVLMDHGVIGQRGQVADLRKWDTSVYEDFQHHLWPIAEALKNDSQLYSKWWKVNNGNLLALDASGAQKLENRAQDEMMTTKSIDDFVAYCENSRTPPSERTDPVVPTTTNPIGGMNSVTATTVEVHEMNPVTQPTVIPG